MNQEIEKKIQKHDTDIELLKNNFDRVVSSLDSNTRQSQELTKELTVYITKHDGLESRMKELQSANSSVIAMQLDHSNKIAEMKPVVDNLRGLVWKVASLVLIGGGGLAAIATALISAMQKGG